MAEKNPDRKIAILGTGNLATTLGLGLKIRGYDVVLGSRNPASCKVEGLTVATLGEAVDFAELVINATPGEKTLEVLESIGATRLGKKILLDAAVATKDNYSALVYLEKSGAELIQEAYPALSVVKALCTMTASVMVDPKSLESPTTVFISGDSQSAKNAVKAVLTELGWDDASQVDLGGLKTALGQEYFAMLYFALFAALGHGNFNVKLHLGAK